MTASVARAVAVPDAEHAAGVVPSREITLKTVCQPRLLLTFNEVAGLRSPGQPPIFLRSFLRADTRSRRIYTKTPTNLDGIQPTLIHAQSPFAGIIESRPLPKGSLHTTPASNPAWQQQLSALPIVSPPRRN